MSTQYLLVDKANKVSIVDQKKVESEVLRRMAKGEKVRVFQASELAVEFTLNLGGEAEAEAPKKATKKRKTRRKASKAAAPAPKKAKAKAKKKKAKKKARKSKSGGEKRGPGRPKVNTGACTVPGCGNEQRTKGLCSAHYQAHRRALKAGKPGLL